MAILMVTDKGNKNQVIELFSNLKDTLPTKKAKSKGRAVAHDLTTEKVCAIL